MTAPHIERMDDPQEVPQRRLYDAATCASYLGIQTATLAMWRHQGKGPKYLKIGRAAYYRPEDIETWLDDQCVVPIRRKGKSEGAARS